LGPIWFIKKCEDNVNLWKALFHFLYQIQAAERVGRLGVLMDWLSAQKFAGEIIWLPAKQLEFCRTPVAPSVPKTENAVKSETKNYAST
jgi:hypothetical protein